MLSRTIKTTAMLGAGILLCATFALAGQKTITLNHDVLLPGGGSLKAGTYAVVVNEKLDQVQFLQNSKVVATHACKCIQGEKNSQDQIQTLDNPGEQPVLQEIRFKGETRTITLPS